MSDKKKKSKLDLGAFGKPRWKQKDRPYTNEGRNKALRELENSGMAAKPAPKKKKKSSY